MIRWAFRVNGMQVVLFLILLLVWDVTDSSVALIALATFLIGGVLIWPHYHVITSWVALLAGSQVYGETTYQVLLWSVQAPEVQLLVLYGLVLYTSLVVFAGALYVLGLGALFLWMLTDMFAPHFIRVAANWLYDTISGRISTLQYYVRRIRGSPN